jgi:hypothetical protein
MAKILMIIAPERFRDKELFITKEELEKAGHETVIANIAKGICPGSRGGFATATSFCRRNWLYSVKSVVLPYPAGAHIRTRPVPVSGVSRSTRCARGTICGRAVGTWYLVRIRGEARASIINTDSTPSPMNLAAPTR